VCHPTKGDETSSLVGRLRLALGHANGRLVNRLDRETSGLVVVALSAESAGRFGRMLDARQVDKQYWAIVHGHPAVDALSIDARLGKDDTSIVAIKDRVREDGAEARTDCRVLRRFVRHGRPFAVLEVTPLTGRKHQIRIHLAHAGHPIVGDKLYGGDETRYLRFVRHEATADDTAALMLPNHALHARELAFEWDGHRWTFQVEPEMAFRAFAEVADVF
jgi:23S rRNA pseudouridine1911/1915/1917 synthase